jgi:hypothetical protein
MARIVSGRNRKECFSPTQMCRFPRWTWVRFANGIEVKLTPLPANPSRHIRSCGTPCGPHKSKFAYKSEFSVGNLQLSVFKCFWTIWAVLERRLWLVEG